MNLFSFVVCIIMAIQTWFFNGHTSNLVTGLLWFIVGTSALLRFLESRNK